MEREVGLTLFSSKDKAQVLEGLLSISQKVKRGRKQIQ